MNDQRNRNTKGQPVLVAALLDRVYHQRAWTRQWRLWQLTRDWPSIVGQEIGRLTTPAFFRQDTLWIFVPDSTWMHHFQFMKPDLMARINKTLDQEPITDLRWRLQPELPSIPKPPVHVARPVNPAQEKAFFEMTKTIANEECRQALRRLWHSMAGLGD